MVQGDVYAAIGLKAERFSGGQFHLVIETLDAGGRISPRAPDSAEEAGKGVTAVYTLEHVHECPACLSTASSVLYEGLTDTAFGIVEGSWTLHQCHNCSSAFLSPRLTQESIGLAYGAGYYTHGSNQSVEQAPLRTLRAFLRTGLLNNYLNKVIGGNRKPSIPFGHVLLENIFRTRKDRVDRSIRNQNHRNGNRLLDLGCGDGSFMLEMRASGWTTFGIEPDPMAAELCRHRGLDVRLSLAEYPDKHVDSITLDHVLEHVHTPLETLRGCLRVLRPNGTIWIAVPNIESRGHERFGPDWLGLDPPRHLIDFTRKALLLLLEDAGFTKIAFLSTYLSPGATYQWSNEIRAKREKPAFPDAQVRRWIKKDRVLPGTLAEELVAVGFKAD